MSQLVSIIVPCYNAGPWLAATLASVQAQTWPHTEVIVVDDGSSDDSLAIARRHEGPAVRLVAQANAGAAAARNAGLRLARGDFIQFLDADDLLAPDKIARQMEVLAAAPAGCIAAGPWGRFEHDRSTAVFAPEENWRDDTPVAWLALNFAGRGMMPPAAWLTPRPIIEAAGPWDERLTLNDDGEYFCRVLLASAGVRFCPEARSYYRSNLAGSLSRRTTAAAWRSAFLSHELCCQHLVAHEDSLRTRRACADLFQRLAFALYADEPSLVAACEEQVRRHGGSSLRPEGGWSFRLAAGLLGWKTARRLQAGRHPKPSCD